MRAACDIQGNLNKEKQGGFRKVREALSRRDDACLEEACHSGFLHPRVAGTSP